MGCAGLGRRGEGVLGVGGADGGMNNSIVGGCSVKGPRCERLY